MFSVEQQRYRDFSAREYETYAEACADYERTRRSRRPHEVVVLTAGQSHRTCRADGPAHRVRCLWIGRWNGYRRLVSLINGRLLE